MDLNVHCDLGECSKCESCIYDMPLDTPLKKLKVDSMLNKNIDYGLLPLQDNPSTAQIVILNGKRQEMPPVGSEEIPLLCSPKENVASKYCNGCEHIIYTVRPGQQTKNCRCKASRTATGVDRILRLKVYEGEKIEKPFWCPVGHEMVRKNLGLEPLSKPQTQRLALPARVEKPSSALSDKQRKEWEESKARNKKRELWLAAPGIMAWDDIKPGLTYHLPPTLKRGRADIIVYTKYPGTIFGRDIKTKDNVWLYREDEDYKFLSEIEND